MMARQQQQQMMAQQQQQQMMAKQQINANATGNDGRWYAARTMPQDNRSTGDGRYAASGRQAGRHSCQQT